MKAKVGSKATKAELIVQLCGYFAIGLLSKTPTEARSQVGNVEKGGPASKSNVNAVSCDRRLPQHWKKQIGDLADFHFMDIYTYLVNSHDKTYDHDAMKCFKQLKAYKYFKDGKFGWE